MCEENMSGDYLTKTKNLDNEAETLAKRFQEIKESQNVEFSFPELQALSTENEKLKYRINILKRHAEELEQADMTPVHDTILNILEKKFQDATAKAYPKVETFAPCITRSTSEKFGDYQFNSAMKIAQALKASGQKVSPVFVAQQVINNISKDDLIQSLDVAGPGFINISIKSEYISQRITQILVEGVKPPPVKRQRVIVDFSSPNVAKEMHVGHLRSTIIGESISRLLEYVGHNVLRLNHIGDWGTQFGMLIAHLEDRFPNYLHESPSIQNLQEFYKESKVRFDNDEEFKKRAYQRVVALQNYEPEIVQAWKLICDATRKEIAQVYKRLDVTITERGESFYQPYMKTIVEDMEKKGILTEDEGRKVLFCSGFKVPLTIVKSDGGFTYDTSDMAALRHRVEDEKADWVVYVVDAGQGLHLETIFAASKEQGYCPPHVRLDHMAFGVVLGEDKKKFKTRSGETVKLADLLNEGLRRSLEKLCEKERDKVLTPEELTLAQNSVTYGCIKYADLCHNRNHDYIFSFDRMLDDKGNTAVYLLYALTRIKSIARTANVQQSELNSAAATTSIVLDHPKEIGLAKMLVRFSEIINVMLEELQLHKLCEYLYELSTAFSEFYDNCYCIVKDVQTGETVSINMSRLLLCEATACVMTKGFHILGLSPVQRM